MLEANSFWRQTDMAGTAESCCIRLKLNDGGQLYVGSDWRSASFAITVLDGARAWSHSVTETQVEDIARIWGISVSNFMKIARSHLGMQHPTATYVLILADTCGETIQLSCTMDDVWDGDLLKLEVRLKKMQNLGAVVCGMLDLLIDTTSKLKEQMNTEDGKCRQVPRQVILRHPEKFPCTRFGSQNDVEGPEDAGPVKESEAEGSILMCFSRDQSGDQLSPYSQAPRRLNIRETSKLSILQPPDFQILGNVIEATTRNYAGMDMDVDTMSYKNLQRSTEGHDSRCSCHDVVIHERFEGPLSEHVMRMLNRLGPTKCKKQSTTDRSHGQDCSEEIKVARDCLQGWGVVRSTDHFSSAHIEQPFHTSLRELSTGRFKTVHGHRLPSTSCHRQGDNNVDDPGCVDTCLWEAAGDQHKQMPSTVSTQCQTWYNSLVEDIPTSTAVECFGRKIKPFASNLPKNLNPSTLNTKEQSTQPLDGSCSEDFSHGRMQINEPESNIPGGFLNNITTDGRNSALQGVQPAWSSDNLPSHNCTTVKSIFGDSRLVESLKTAPKSDVANAACRGDACAPATGGGYHSSICEVWEHAPVKRINPSVSRENIINTISRSAGNVQVKHEDMSRGNEEVPSVHEDYSRAISNYKNDLSNSRADYIEDIIENDQSASMIADYHERAVDGPDTDKKFNLLEKGGCITAHKRIAHENSQGSSHQSLSHRSTSHCKVTENFHERQSSGADTMFERPCRRTSDSVSMKERSEEDAGNTNSNGCNQMSRRPWTDNIATIREEKKELNTFQKGPTCTADDGVILDSLQLEESNVNSHRQDSIPSGCGQEKHGIPIVREDEEGWSRQTEKEPIYVGDHDLEYTVRNSFRLGAEYIGRAQWKAWLQEAKTEEKDNCKESLGSATRDELSNKVFNTARNEVELEQFGRAEIRTSIAERKSNEVDTNIPGRQSPPFPEKTEKIEQILRGNSSPKTRREVRDTTRSEGKVKRQTELELLRMPVKEVKKEAIEEMSRVRRRGTIAEQMALIDSEDKKKKTRETNDNHDFRGTKDSSRKNSAVEDVRKRKGKRTDYVPNHQVAKRMCSGGIIETHVPDADHYEFDKDRTESHVKMNQVWAFYDDIDGMPRNWAHIQRVVHLPHFKAWVSWLKPHNPSLQTVKWKESTGYTVPCGLFKAGKPDVLTGINCFSHLMVVDWEANDLVHIYPRKGEVWALFKKGAMQHNKTVTREGMSDKKASKGCPKSIAVPKFRLVEVLANIDGARSPVEIQVLGKVPGFRTIWGPFYTKGALPSNSICLFSHRVPAYRLQGGENPKILQDCWDIDPAGLPPDDD